VTAGVIDDLELIDVQIAQGVGGLAGLGALERALDAILEFAPVHQAREQIVAGVIAQAPIELARFTDIVEHQHPAPDLAVAGADRRGGTLDVQLVAIPPDQQHRPHRLDRPGAPD
jgi:hypothetical protein